MKTLVVYYSLSGTTRACAMSAAKELSADVAEIHTAKPIKSGNFLPVAKMMLTGSAAIQPVEANPRDYDLIVLAAPIWAGKAARPLTTWLRGVSLMQKDIGLLLTCDGNAFKALEKLAPAVPGARVVGSIGIVCGKRPLSELEEEARLWADELREEKKSPPEGNA